MSVIVLIRFKDKKKCKEWLLFYCCYIFLRAFVSSSLLRTTNRVLTCPLCLLSAVWCRRVYCARGRRLKPRPFAQWMTSLDRTAMGSRASAGEFLANQWKKRAPRFLLSQSNEGKWAGPGVSECVRPSVRVWLPRSPWSAAVSRGFWLQPPGYHLVNGPVGKQHIHGAREPPQPPPVCELTSVFKLAAAS